MSSDAHVESVVLLVVCTLEMDVNPFLM